MQLPNARNAVVPEAKITQYLLNFQHPKGKDKAEFFTRFGFSLAEWQILRDALLTHARVYEVTSTREVYDGTNYSLHGALSTPDGRNPLIRTVWIIREGQNIPSFVTAYPK